MKYATLNLAVAVLGLALTALAATPPAPQPAAAPAAAESEEKSAQGVGLLVLSITSDEEKLGHSVLEALNFKAKRLGAVVYDPASVTETAGGEQFSVATPATKLAAVGREKFKADIVVVGHVKGKAAGACEVRLVAVHTDDPKSPTVFEKTYSCPEPQYRGIEMARAVYDILGLEQPKDPLRMLREDPQISQRWLDGPNMVRNPGFELPNAKGTGPADWQDIGSLSTGGTVSWVANPDGPGKVIRYEMDEDCAGTYGIGWYSEWVAIEPGATYRFSCRYKSMAPTPKIFLKGYHEFPPQEGFPAQRRETYRRQVHPSGPAKQWNSVTADFVPEASRPDQRPTWLKVDLYAYWPAGVIYWDDIVLKKVRDAPTR